MTEHGVRSRPARVVTVSVAGREPRRQRDNGDHIDLMVEVSRALRRRTSWGPLDAVLFPAGYFRLKEWFGPLHGEQRLSELASEEPGGVCVGQAKRLGRKFPGCLVVAGFDTKRWRGWRGDMMMAAFDANGGVGLARMIYPTCGDKMLVFEPDFDNPDRVVTLPNGERALLSCCYDAFALAELRRGNAGKRGNLRHLGEDEQTWRKFLPGEARQLLDRTRKLIAGARPTVGLVGIHTVKLPGAELRWQRHGLATASAALDGALVVGASHWTEQMPGSVGQSPLAADRVALKHLELGNHRPTREHKASDGFEVSLRDDFSVRALVRLYERAEA